MDFIRQWQQIRRKIDNDEPDISYPDFLESLISLVYNFCYKRQLHIKTDFSVTGWILCVIPHIHKYAIYYLDSYHRKHVNNVIKKWFYGWSEYEIDFNQDLFCIEYTDFYNNNGSFDGDEFIWKRKDIRYGNSHLCHKKYSLPCTKVIGFLVWRVMVTSKVLGIGSAEIYWGDGKTIKSSKISAIRSDASEKQDTV